MAVINADFGGGAVMAERLERDVGNGDCKSDWRFDFLLGG